jgi:hypothetical protein
MNDALQSPPVFFWANAGEALKVIVAESSAVTKIAVWIADQKIPRLRSGRFETSRWQLNPCPSSAGNVRSRG